MKVATLAVAALVPLLAAAERKPLGRRSATEPFPLYAYGDSIGGLQVFSAGGT
jgi:hypothetical protein